MADLSVPLADSTFQQLEDHLRDSGQTREYVVEQAILLYLRVMQELPADLVVQPRLVVQARTGESLLKEIEQALPPDPLRDLLRLGD